MVSIKIDLLVAIKYAKIIVNVRVLQGRDGKGGLAEAQKEPA